MTIDDDASRGRQLSGKSDEQNALLFVVAGVAVAVTGGFFCVYVKLVSISFEGKRKREEKNTNVLYNNSQRKS